MEARRIIRTDVAASAIAHVSVVAFIILLSEVHPFRAAPTQTVAVDIVTPDDLKETPEPPPAQQMPAPDLIAMAKTEALSLPTPPQPAPQAARPQEQPSSAPGRREAKAAPQTQPAPPSPSYAPPQPDVTVKYGVMLGLPEELPPLVKDADKGSDGGDAKASTAADLSSSVIAEFRRHLRKCAKLPASVAPSDNVMIKLRAVMNTDGRLATDPILIEASASAKGPILMQSAKSALEACQPYTMLPADRYGEWKVIDLIFTPLDFDAS
ncbi:MAG: hypothetical protein HY852_24080 [Bradyrhizobium sp.]|uniref:hypothetical protein n=1 Tax=Bradyrhizobium sp. TaxID=376 RepID=UPI0025C01526|nr:hypothetical protein [Bradyrhizobium sp.]MBI5264886.1 hypothetical protein [Bradyrhizobium sp.]